MDRRSGKIKEVYFPKQVTAPDVYKNQSIALDKRKQNIINSQLPLETLTQNIQSFEPFEAKYDVIKNLNASLKVIENHKKKLSTEDKSQNLSAWEVTNPIVLNAFDKIGQFTDPSHIQCSELTTTAQQNSDLYRAVSELRSYFPNPESWLLNTVPPQEYTEAMPTDKSKINERAVKERYKKLIEDATKYNTKIKKYLDSSDKDTEEKKSINSNYMKIGVKWNEINEKFKNEWKNIKSHDEMDKRFSQIEDLLDELEKLSNRIENLEDSKLLITKQTKVEINTSDESMLIQRPNKMQENIVLEKYPELQNRTKDEMEENKALQLIEVAKKEKTWEKYENLSFAAQEYITKINQYTERIQWKEREQKEDFEYYFGKIEKNWKNLKKAFEQAHSDSKVTEKDQLLANMQKHLSEDIERFHDKIKSLVNNSHDSHDTTININSLIISLKYKGYTNEISEYINQIDDQINIDCSGNPNKAKQIVSSLETIIDRLRDTRDQLKILSSSEKEPQLSIKPKLVNMKRKVDEFSSENIIDYNNPLSTKTYDTNQFNGNKHKFKENGFGLLRLDMRTRDSFFEKVVTSLDYDGQYNLFKKSFYVRKKLRKLEASDSYQLRKLLERHEPGIVTTVNKYNMGKAGIGLIFTKIAEFEVDLDQMLEEADKRSLKRVKNNY